MQLIYTIAGVDNGTIFTLNVFKVFVEKYINEIHVPKAKLRAGGEKNSVAHYNMFMWKFIPMKLVYVFIFFLGLCWYIYKYIFIFCFCLRHSFE